MCVCGGVTSIKSGAVGVYERDVSLAMLIPYQGFKGVELPPWSMLATKKAIAIP